MNILSCIFLFSYLTLHTASQYGVGFLIINLLNFFLYRKDVYVSYLELNWLLITLNIIWHALEQEPILNTQLLRILYLNIQIHCLMKTDLWVWETCKSTLLFTLIELFNILKYKCPISINELITPSSQNNEISLILPNVTLDIGLQSFVFSSSKLWNQYSKFMFDKCSANSSGIVVPGSAKN